MGRNPEHSAGRLSRRDLIGFATAETAGVVLTALGVVDRSNTPAPENPLPPASAELIKYNATVRLRPSLLLGTGGALMIAPIAAYFSLGPQRRK